MSSGMPNAHTAFSKPSLPRTLAFVVAAIAILSILDTYLAKEEHSESLVEAKRSYDSGRRFMEQGKNDRAVDEFRAALVVARDNPEYQLALGEALANSGRLPDAEAELNDELAHDGTAAAPNLAMARVLMKEGRIQEAFSFYHRAIYGRWKQNALAHRVEVRFELIDLLVSRNEKEGLLAELLPLQEEAPDDAATKKKLASLFISAGSPVRGADLFRDVLRSNPQDADAYAGLGDAEFARGNYRTALAHYETALRLRPADDHARRRAEICNQVLALDPTQRALSTEEQYKRSVKLLDLVMNDVRQCLGAYATTSSGTPLGGTLDSAGEALKQRVSAARQHAALETNLDLLDKLWQARKTECKGSAEPVDESLSLVLNRLAQ
jgi:tetratricopeptide (TPR) repeat protein